MDNTASVGARLGLSGTLEFRDKDGNVLKTVDFVGSVPLEQTGMSVEQAQSLIEGTNHGSNDC